MKYYRIKFNYDNFVKAESKHDALVRVLETIPESHFSNSDIVTGIDAKTEQQAWDIYIKTSSWIYTEVVDILARIIEDEMGSDIKLTLDEVWKCCQSDAVNRAFNKCSDGEWQYEQVEDWVRGCTGKGQPFLLDADERLIRNPSYKEVK